MVRLEAAFKAFAVPGGEKIVLDHVTTEFPPRRCTALIGRNGAGKSTLLKLISGTLELDGGALTRTGSISWPIGFAGSFHPDLTAAQNTRFVARIYGVDTDELVAFVKDFAELGKFFDMPFRTFSQGMRARLAFGVSMGVRFDCYLIDEVTAVGDAAFRRKCTEYLRDRLKSSGAIVVSHSLPMLKEICDGAMVLESGVLQYFADVDRAITAHQRNLRV